MSAVADLQEVREDYEGEDSRYAIYVVQPNHPTASTVGDALRQAFEGRPRKRIAETSLDGIGLCLQTLRDEDEITDDSRIGIFDRLSRKWLVNPWAKGDLA